MHSHFESRAQVIGIYHLQPRRGGRLAILEYVGRTDHSFVSKGCTQVNKNFTIIDSLITFFRGLALYS